MDIRRLPESTQTLYAELLEQAIHDAASSAAEGAPVGTFVRKTIKGRQYHYLQVIGGDRKEQRYLGADSEPLRAWIDAQRAGQASVRVLRTQRARLCAMLAAGGATTESAPVTRALRVLEDAGVFRLGGVLVGTVAFRCYANLLGVLFESQAGRTQDIDIAHDAAITVALAGAVPAADVPQALARPPLSFFGVPGLDPRSPSTSFRVRGRELRIDFLTPHRPRTSAEPVFIAPLRLSAQPVAGLEYLLEQTPQAAVIGMEDVLVNLPAPARFALHKLVLSRSRPAAFQAKARKDLLQAEQLLAVLLTDRPADIEEAWERLAQARKFARLAREAAAFLPDQIRSSLMRRLSS